CVSAMTSAMQSTPVKGIGVGKKLEVVPPNVSFATTLDAMQQRLRPTVDLMSLLCCASLQHRHLDVLESETGLPVLRLDEVTPTQMVHEGGLDHLEAIRESVATANEEAEVETRLDACEKAMNSWTSDICTDRIVDIAARGFGPWDLSDGGFALPAHFFETLRSIALYVQRDVGSKYAAPITTRARAVENTMLWAMHSGSLLKCAQQYISVGSILMTSSSAHRAVYSGAINKWYSLRKSVKRLAKSRLLDVLMDTDFSENVHAIVASLSPTIQTLSHRSMHDTLLASSGDGTETSLRGLMTIPAKATYIQAPQMRPVPKTLVSQCKEGEMYVPYAPVTLFNVDGFIVAKVPGQKKKKSPTTLEEGDEEEEDVWEITGVTSTTRIAAQADLLRLRDKVPLSEVRGLIPRDVRQSMREAVVHDTDSAISDLEADEMDAFWTGHTYHAKHTVSLEGVASLRHAVKDILAQIQLPEYRQDRADDRYLCEVLVPEWTTRVLGRVQGDTVHVPVLSVPCVSRYMFQSKALCYSSMGVHHRHIVNDWLGAVNAADLGSAADTDQASSLLESDRSTDQFGALLAKGVTLGVCNAVGAGIGSTGRYMQQLCHELGMAPFVMSANQHPDPRMMACTISNLILEGHLVYLIGVENASPELLALLVDITNTLRLGGEFPYAKGPTIPHGESPDSDLCVVRNPLGKSAPHPSEHTVGALAFYLPVLVPGPFVIPDHLPKDCAIRYIDVRRPPEKLRFIPKCTGRPCLALRTTYAAAKPQIFLDPSDVAIAMRIRDEGDYLGGSDADADSEAEAEGDSPETAVYKYLSMSFRPSDREGLLSAVSAAFGSSIDGERQEPVPDYGQSQGILSGEGVYAAKWLNALLETPDAKVWIQSPCINTGLAIVQHAARESGASIDFRRHPNEVELPRRGLKSADWQVIDMRFDTNGTTCGYEAEEQVAQLSRMFRVAGGQRSIMISPTLPTHNQYMVHTLRVNLGMVNPPAALRQSILTHTGVRPDINDQDPVAFFFGVIGRFLEVLDVSLSSLEGSFVQAMMWWLLSEQGVINLVTPAVEIDINDAATKGRIHVGQRHVDPAVFGLPNVGPVLQIEPCASFFETFGEGTPLGHTVALFMCAFATVYTGYSFLTALDADFGGDYEHMMGVTTQERALDSLRAVHPGFDTLKETTLASCFPEDLDPKAFVPLRFNPEEGVLETYTLRDPIVMEDYFMTHPRWNLSPVLTATNRGFVHSLAACMVFGVPGIVNSRRTVGKTWAVNCATNLLPTFCQALGDVALEGRLDGLSNHITRSDDGSVVPLFQHGLTVSLDDNATSVSELLSHSTFEQLISRSVMAANFSDKADLWRMGGRPQGTLPVEQNDALGCAYDAYRLEGVSILAETHLDLSSASSDPLVRALPSYAFMFNADQLIDYELVETLFASMPMKPDSPKALRGVLLQVLFNICDFLDMSPLRILDSIKRLGLLATRADPSLYYVDPSTLFVAGMRVGGRIFSDAEKQEAMKAYAPVIQAGLTHLLKGPEFILSMTVKPDERRAWSDIITSLQSGPGAPPPKSYYFVSDCAAPLLRNQYPLAEVLSQLDVGHPDVIPTLLRTAVQMECWMAVNNTVAQSVEDMGVSSGLRQLCVPTMTLALLKRDTTDMYTAGQLLFKLLAYNVTLSNVATAGYTKKARSQRQKAQRQSTLDATVDSSREGKPMTNRHGQESWETGSIDSHRSRGSLRSGAVSVGPSAVQSSHASETSASFFGSEHERYLPRLVVDLDVIYRGLGVAESRESSLHQVIWGAMSIPVMEDKYAAFMRLAVVLACGLPASLVLPLTETRQGVTIDANVSPYKVFPSGEVNSQISAKYHAEKTLFSRVLLHIPGDMLNESPLLQQCFVALSKGLVPPVFSRAALGQIYLSLGEKYSLPQPDASTLVMKMAQHLTVVVTTNQAPRESLSYCLNMSYPSKMKDLLKATQSSFRYLRSRYSNDGPMEKFDIYLRKMAGQFAGICKYKPDPTIEFHKYMTYAMSCFQSFVNRSVSERTSLKTCLSLLANHEPHLDSSDPTIMQYVDDLKAGCDGLMPMDETEVVKVQSLNQRGPNVALFFLYLERFWEKSYSEPEFMSMRVVLETFCGIEDMRTVTLSKPLYVCAQAHTYYFNFPPTSQPKPFLWLYVGALPARDTSLLACILACQGSVHYPMSIPFLDKEDGVATAECVLYWRDGLLENLNVYNSKEKNDHVLSQARKRCNIAVLPMDLPGHLFYPLAVKAINEGCHIILSEEVAASQESLSFMNLLIRYFSAQNTRPGQILRFQDGKYVCRLKHPVHKMRIYICMDREAYHPSVTLNDCRGVFPTLTLQILKVFEDVCGPSDTGPFQQAALLEEESYIVRTRFWNEIRDLTRVLLSTTPSPEASTALLRGTGHIKKLSRDVVTSYFNLAKLWGTAGIEYGLTAAVNAVEAHMLRFPNPVVRALGSLDNQMKHLKAAVSEHVQAKGYQSLNQATVQKLFYQSCNALIASTSVPNALFDRTGQMQILLLQLCNIQLVSTGQMDERTSEIIGLATGSQFDRLEAMADPATVDKIYAVALKHRGTPLGMFPVLSTAFRRMAVLEALSDDYKGIMERTIRG
ncbi:hypothetical protein KIPB_000871, partial [Kipferlia bialata]